MTVSNAGVPTPQNPSFDALKPSESFPTEKNESINYLGMSVSITLEPEQLALNILASTPNFNEPNMEGVAVNHSVSKSNTQIGASNPLPLPGKSDSPQQKIIVLKDKIADLEKIYQTLNPDSPRAKNISSKIADLHVEVEKLTEQQGAIPKEVQSSGSKKPAVFYTGTFRESIQLPKSRAEGLDQAETQDDLSKFSKAEKREYRNKLEEYLGFAESRLDRAESDFNGFIKNYGGSEQARLSDPETYERLSNDVNFHKAEFELVDNKILLLDGQIDSLPK